MVGQRRHLVGTAQGVDPGIVGTKLQKGAVDDAGKAVMAGQPDELVHE